MPYLTSAKGVPLDHYSAPEKNAKGAPFDWKDSVDRQISHKSTTADKKQKNEDETEEISFYTM